MRYITLILAFSMIMVSYILYNTFLETKSDIIKTNNETNINYVKEVSKNLGDYVKEEIDEHKIENSTYITLEKNQKLRGHIEKEFRLFITKKYKYIYLVDKEKTDSENFRVLLDAAKGDEKSDFAESYQPLETKEWEKVYKTKKPLYFTHKKIKSLWMTYLHPIIINNKIEAVLVVDFSMADHSKIKTALSDFDELFEIIGVVFALIFLMLITFSYIDARRDRVRAKIAKELKQKSSKLEEKSEKLFNLNVTLKHRVECGVEDNRKKDQQIIQQARLAQMGEMISMIAHQWRQPLAAISSTSAAINLKAKLNKLDKDMAISLSNNITTYSKHLSSTIDDFREFFKSDKAKEDTDFNKIIKYVLNIVEESISNKNIKIIKEFNSEKTINTFESELKQVVLNLIKNAEDILLEKNIRYAYIKIRTYEEKSKQIIEISDNGGGIPDDIKDKIFDSYFSTKKEKNGTGLGLYMSKIIVEDHCVGKLSVKNDKNGAVFRVEI